MNKEIMISNLIVYPIKSMGPVFLQKAEVTPLGLKYDRRYVLIDALSNEIITQRKNPELSKFKLEILEEDFKVSFDNENILVPFYRF